MFGWSQKDKDNALRRVLRHAEYYGIDVDGVRTALQKGASPTIGDEHGIPLVCKIAGLPPDGEAREAVEALLDAGADVNTRHEKNGRTPLHYATMRGNEETIRMLVGRGADIHARCRRDESVLGTALLHSGDNGVIRTLIGAGALEGLSDRERLNIFCRAIQQRDLEPDIIEALAAGIADFNRESDDYGPPVHALVRRGRFSREICDFVLSRPGIDVNAVYGETPLYRAIANDKGETASALVRAGARVDREEDGSYPLVRAAERDLGNVIYAILDVCKQAGRKPDGLQDALAAAAGSGQVKAVRLLMEAGADVNEASGNGVTPLMRAAEGGHVDVMEMLVAAGASADAVDGEGNTLKSYARGKKAQAFVRRLTAPPPPFEPIEKGDFKRLNDHSIEVKQGGSLTVTFNFNLQQAIYRDGGAMVVRNFNEIQRQEAVDEAREKLVAMGGKPPCNNKGFEKALPALKGPK